MQCFEHHYTRHHGKFGEMVSQVLFLCPKRPFGHQSLSRDQFDDSIQLVVFHDVLASIGLGHQIHVQIHEISARVKE
jgi:hypothetical protein